MALTIYRGHRLRKHRYAAAGSLYLLTAVTKERKRYFLDPKNARIAAGSIRHFHDAAIASTITWVVMPDHVHWLCLLQRGDLASLMRRFKGWTAQEINRLHGTTGTQIWQKGYHEHGIRKSVRLDRVVQYIVMNPVRAGLVENPWSYPYMDAPREELGDWRYWHPMCPYE